MSEYMNMMKKLTNVHDEVSKLRRELTDAAITFGGHPAMNLRFSPGDTLVIKMDTHVTHEIAARVREMAEACVPDGVKIMIIGKSTDISKLERV